MIMSNNKKRLTYTALLVLAFLVGSLLLTHSSVEAFLQDNKKDKSKEEREKRVVHSQEEAVQQVVEQVGPAVVSIVTTNVAKMNDSRSFPIAKQRKGLGSGFIFDKDGYILTNNHVIKNADKIKVLLSDGRKLKGELVGRDSRNDLAVIKIDANNLPVAPLGNSDKLTVGQLAIAIGSPFDVEFRNTVTTGVVSALNRTIRIGNNAGFLEGLIQTDASINPGNSGGPLLNSKGQVIGINTAIINYAQGIGFSIPINKAQDIAKDLIKYGKVKRPWLGIYGMNLNEEVINYYNLPIDNGIIIARVMSNSPAAKVNLSSNDVIVEANHQKIKDMKQLRRIIKKVGINGKLDLLILKANSGELKPVTVTLKEMPNNDK